ncbi:MAG: PEP-CTERM sorting domain-containing protein [Acidobacteria bacterium]|nr:PEP-CTERM sorting domain-containing protein [Acidobacteriota bacterium]
MPFTRGSLIPFTFTRNGNGPLTGGSVVITVETPEPGTLGLLGAGLIGLAGLARRQLNPGA